MHTENSSGDATRFKVGDRVRVESNTGANDVLGIVVAVMPNLHGLGIFTEYEVDFGVAGIRIAYETQLKVA